MPPGARSTRIALALASAGHMSLALETQLLRPPASNEIWVLGFGSGLVAAILAGRREPYWWSVPALVAATVALYSLALVRLGAHPAVVASYALSASAAIALVDRRRRALAAAAIALWTPALHVLAPAAPGSLPAYAALAAVGAIGVALVLLRGGDAGAIPALLAVGASAAVADRHLAVSGPGLDDLALVALVIAAPALAVARARVRALASLTAGILLVVGLAAAYVLGSPYDVDPPAAVHHAAELLVAGRQPYASFDLRDALDRFGVDRAQGTHLEDGGQLLTFSYPPVSFLFVAPFVALGLDDIRPLYAAALLVLVPLLATRLGLAPALVLAAVLGNVVLLRQHVLGGVDPLWIPLIAAAFLFPERRLVSALALGLAVADRQPAWALAPFVLLAVWRERGPREAALRAAIAGATAAAVSLPFFVTAPGAFIAGVFGPLVGPLEPYGVGLVRIGWTPDFTAVLPRGVHAAVAVAGALAAGALLWSRWRIWSGALRVAGFVPLWLAWRSLMSYFDAAPLLALPPEDEPGPEVRSSS